MSYLTVEEGGSAEITEKKSRFIGSVFHVETEEEALAKVEMIRKKYYDARHHCFAYVLASGGQRASDDGEPQGTAGRPVLDLLTGRGLKDTLIVVTRYFGGTLLGTGGLVRCYQAAAECALLESLLIEKRPGFLTELEAEYTLAGKLQYLFGTLGVVIMSSEYTEQVLYRLLVPQEVNERFCKELLECSAGRLKPGESRQVLYYKKGDTYRTDPV